MTIDENTPDSKVLELARLGNEDALYEMRYRILCKMMVMIDENTPDSKVLELARLGDKDALYEMRYRCYLDNEEAPDVVWAAYWDEKAAEKGHIYAKRRCAGYYKDIPPSANFKENRQKAMDFFESIVKDYNDGKLDEDDRSVGVVAKTELGIMLCEGLGTPLEQRDCKRGVELIKSAEMDMQSFGGFKFPHLLLIGELYALGFAQEDEAPSKDDLVKAIAYLERAIADFKPDRDDPRKLEHAKQLLDVQRKHLPVWRQDTQEYNLKVAKERRAKLSQPREVGQQLDDYMRRLRERLAREGW